jgi:hypothetical protein
MTVGAKEDSIGGVVEHARAACRRGAARARGEGAARALGIRMPRQVFVSRPVRSAWAAALVRDTSRRRARRGQGDRRRKTSCTRATSAASGGVATARARSAGLRGHGAAPRGPTRGFTSQRVRRVRAGARPTSSCVGLRWTGDFGPVVTLGPAASHTEFLAKNLEAGLRDRACSRRRLTDARPSRRRSAGWRRRSSRAACGDSRRDRRGRRGRPRSRGFMALAAAWMPDPFRRVRDQPARLHEAGLVALDILVKLGRGPWHPGRSGRSTSSTSCSSPGSVADHRRVEVDEPRAHHRQQPDPRRVRALAHLRRQAGRAEMEGLPLRARRSSRCRNGWTCSSSRSPPRRCRRDGHARSSRAKAESVIVIPGGLEEKARHRGLVGRCARRSTPRAGASGRARSSTAATASASARSPAATTRCSSRPTRCRCRQAGVAARVRVAERRVRRGQGSKLDGIEPRYVDHDRQPDGPDRRRLHAPT